MTDELKRLWETGTQVRENYFSITKRNEFSMNSDEIRTWDIQRIEVPFPRLMEEKLKIRFHLREEDLKDFYTNFVTEVGNHLQTLADLRERHNAEKIDPATLYYEARKINRDEDGRYDIYIVTEPAETLAQAGLITTTGTLLSNALLIGIRLLQSIRNYNDCGVSVGTVDLDSVLVTKKNGVTYIRNAGFFATAAPEKTPAPTVDLTTHMPQELKSGNVPPSFNNDIYSVCSILWTVLDGNDPSVAPDVTHPPRFCSEELAGLLNAAMQDGVGTYKELIKELRQELNGLNDETLEDRFIPFAAPYYAEAFAILEAEERNSAAQQQKTENPPQENGHQKLLKILIVSAAAVISLAASFFFFIRPIMLTPTPVITPEPIATAAPIPHPTPSPDPNEGKPDTTSAEVGLYSFDDIILDYYGNPSSRFYLNESGDIECEPSKFPARYEELEFSDKVLNLRETEFPSDLSKTTLPLTPEKIIEYGLQEGSLLLPNGWDLTTHLRRVDGFEFVPEDALVKTFLRYASVENVPERPRASVRRETLETIETDEDRKSVFTELLCEALGANLSEEKKEAWNKVFDPTAVVIDVVLADSDWYEEYQCCDDATYAKLRLIERESECDRIHCRKSNANGAEIVLYYDNAGNTYSETEWKEQESLRTSIEEAKAELDSYKAVEGTLVLVPHWGVEEYVFVEAIRFGANPMEVNLKGTLSGKAVPDSFMVSIQIEPVNATCREVEATINRENGLTVPYSYNSEFITGTHATYESMREMTLDFSGCEDGKLALAMDGSAFGRYGIAFASMDGNTKAELTIELKNDGAVPSPTPAPTPVPSQSSSGSGSHSPTPVQPAPVVCTPAPTPRPTPTPTAAPIVEDDNALTVTPETLSMKVGDTYDLKPSMSCSWMCSAPEVASVGGTQGRTVSAKKAGTCEITARTGDGQTFVVRVTVE